MYEEKRAVIFGSVKSDDMSYVRRYIPARLLIAADGGSESIRCAGLEPDVYVGDGDSGGEANGVKEIILPEEKDLTDSHACINYALQEGMEQIIMLCCTGGRLDHFLANVMLLEYIAEKGAFGMIADGQNEITIYTEPIWISESTDFKYLSVIPIDSEARGVTLTGVKYPLYNAVLRRGDSLGISNEIRGLARLEIESGAALIVRSRDEK